jgi:uncharacterized Zn finger protein (UPF0148 family)
MRTRHNCGHCHTCGSPLRRVLDGEEWCPRCGQYRRYQSHGWDRDAAEKGWQQCPPPQPMQPEPTRRQFGE